MPSTNDFVHGASPHAQGFAPMSALPFWLFVETQSAFEPQDSPAPQVDGSSPATILEFFFCVILIDLEFSCRHFFPPRATISAGQGEMNLRIARIEFRCQFKYSCSLLSLVALQFQFAQQIMG